MARTITKVTAATLATAALIAAPLAAHAETVEYDIAVRDLTVTYPDGGASVLPGQTIEVSYAIVNEGDVDVTAPGPNIRDAYVASIEINGQTYGTSVSEDGEWTAESWSHTPDTGSYELLSTRYVLADGTVGAFEGTFAPGARWEVSFRAPVSANATPDRTIDDGVAVSVWGDGRVDDDNYEDGFFETVDTNPGNNNAVLPLVLGALPVDEPAEEEVPTTEEPAGSEGPATEEPATEEPSEEEPTVIVEAGPFTQITRLQTNVPGQSVTIRSLDGADLPTIDLAAYTLSADERTALDAFCEDLGEYPDGVDCLTVATGSVSGKTGQWRTEQTIAARSVAYDVLAAQAARGAIFEGSTATLTADADGFVYLPGGTVEFEVEVPFAGSSTDDPAASWRTARFELLAAPTGDAYGRTSDGGPMWGFVTGGFFAWFAQADPATYGAGAGGFQEEATTWTIGANLYVRASVVPLPVTPEPEVPVEPETPAESEPEAPVIVDEPAADTPRQPTPVTHSETGDGGVVTAQATGAPTGAPVGTWLAALVAGLIAAAGTRLATRKAKG